MEVHIVEVLVYKAPSLVEHLLKLILDVFHHSFLYGNLGYSSTCRVHFVECSSLECIKFCI